MLTRSRPDLCENSTAYTTPSCPTISDTCDTVVPLAAPKYRTLHPGGMWIFATPPTTEAANLERNGFHTLYSIFSPSSSTEILFSPYTLSPGTIFFVTKTSSFPLAIKIPSCLCGSTSVCLPAPNP
ncbi:unnamed protein product, partial [Meganyctiphanes norvegica]